MTSVRDTRRDWAFASLLLTIGCVVYALFVVQSFAGPLIGGADYDGQYRGDANYFEFLGYYVRDHWHFGLHPITFFTKDVGYPTGTHIGLLSWCAERDLLAATLLKLFGRGPWIQLYVTLGATLGAVGVTAILRPQLGVLKSSFVGFAASFMSFYAWYKYPYHLNISVLHWVTMSIAADAVTMRRVVQGERLSVPFMVFRAALIVMSIGLDLGYVAGHALTSFFVTVVYAWGYLGRRDRRIVARLRLALPEHPLAELRERPAAILGGLLLLLFGLVLYVPFVFAVVKDTTTYPMTDAGGNYWASQFHALFPYLPGVAPNNRLTLAIFGRDEGVGEYQPGFALVGALVVGMWLAHKRDRTGLIKPLVVTALLVFAFHPRWCKTLHVFPWFAYNRVAGRGTVVLPVLLALVGAQMEDWPRLAKRVVGAFAVVEFITATFFVNEFHPARLEAKHFAYFDKIKSTPGEALLEWPFCIASANGVITRELCPYNDRTSTAYANRRFFEKSTVSIYLSRVHKTQFPHWIDEGWPSMFMPDDPTREHPKRELRCFDDEQWARFDRLYRGHDFAGIQLYLDVLPTECVTAFHARYGEPVASETLPRLGRVEFIPRVR